VPRKDCVLGAAKKLQNEQPLDPVDQPTERELKLAKNFEDPGLDEILPGGEPAEPVQLIVVGEGDALPIPENEVLPIPDPEAARGPFPLPPTVNMNPDPLERSLLISPRNETEATAFGIEGSATEATSLFKMAEDLFVLIASERTFDDVVDAGLRAVMGAVNAHAGSVLELDHQHEDFFFRASHGGTATLSKLSTFRVPLTKGIVGHVAESGQPLLIRNLAEDEKQMRAISVSVGFDAVTCMAAPILVGGQPYGVIEVFNRRDGGFFDEKDLRVLEEGVRMMAKVLEVRFLLAELARRVR